MQKRFIVALWGIESTYGRPDGKRSVIQSLVTLAYDERRTNGHDLPQRNLKASLIFPAGKAGPAYLVFRNFKALRRWNKSNSFAVAVGTLADSF